ncbi:MAG: hypothetical protein JWN98_2180 [Abditibacteriota bacterium]|nr:hypothetical protein [Abditibacteriota bacterium]
MILAYLLDTFPSASETFIAREIDALRRRGFEVRVFALHAGKGAQRLDVPAAPLGKVKAGLTRKIRGPKYFEDLGAAWYQRERDVGLRDVEHIHAGWASHPAEIALGAAEASGLSWSFSGHARDLWVDGRDFARKLQRASFATVCTRSGQRLLAQRAPDAAHKVLYAPHGLELSRFEFRSRVFRGEGPLKILSVGRLVEKKGFAVLLQALETLARDNFDFYAVIIGDGPLRDELTKECQSRQLQKRVLFAGAMALDEVVDAMHEADCLALPCLQARDGDRDGLPNVLLEAAACGLPIVSTTAGSITDFLDVTTAYLCQPEDAAALISALRELAGDASTTRALALAARERVEELFDIDQNIKILVQALLGRGADFKGDNS